MKRVHEDYLNDIIEAIRLIEEFTENINFDEFIKDKKTQFAVIRALEIIGEAAKNIPNEVKSNHAKVLGVRWQECETSLFMHILELILE